MLWTRLRTALLCCMAERIAVSAMALIGVGHIFIGVWTSVVASVASPTSIIASIASIVSSITSIVAIPSSIVPMGWLLSLPGVRIPVTGRSLRELLSDSSCCSLVVEELSALYSNYSKPWQLNPFE